ncbi:RpiB/LacA/LacB family sugar-phosphate isomerase [Candidatus Saccharibacteria bacterium]|nr:RpiB/LacA/LacB family sugar-phosphate isomerase [Candidatus Saccharibacteria bacterium]
MPEKVTIFIGADYRGFQKKSELIPYLKSCHQNFIKVVDKGAFDDSLSDYNDPAIAVAKAIKSTPNSFGILLCGSAHGVCMQANRFKGIRAINAFSPESAQIGREHDNANVLCLSAELFDLETLKKIIYSFFHTKFGREERRVRRLARLDEENYD